MIPLNASALAKAGSTDAFKTERFGRLAVIFRGDLDGETLTMYCSRDKGVTFKAFTAATVAQTYTNSDDVINMQDYELPGGCQWKWTMSNGAGTPANVFVEVEGQNVAKA